MCQWTRPSLIEIMAQLSPDWLQAIISTNAGILLIEPSGSNFSEILNECLCFNVLKDWKISNSWPHFQSIWLTFFTVFVSDSMLSALVPLFSILSISCTAIIVVCTTQTFIDLYNVDRFHYLIPVWFQGIVCGSKEWFFFNSQCLLFTFPFPWWRNTLPEITVPVKFCCFRLLSLCFLLLL